MNKNIPELGNLQTPPHPNQRKGETGRDFLCHSHEIPNHLDHDRWARFQPQQCSKNSALMKQANVNTPISREDNIRRGFYRWPNSTHKQDYILSFPFVISENLPLKWKPFAVGLFLFCVAYRRNLRNFRSHFHSYYRGAFWTALRTMLWVDGNPSQTQLSPYTTGCMGCSESKSHVNEICINLSTFPHIQACRKL